MKTIQRYTPDSFTSTKDGSVVEGSCFADDYGEYVLHADHLSALASKDAEMARVKIAIVEWATYADTRSTNHGLNMTPHQVLHSILRRAALSTAPGGEAMSENVEANALLKKIADTISLLPSISGLSPVTRFEDIPMAIRDLQECYKSAARSRNGADLAAENAALKQFHEAAQHGAEAFLAQIRFADSRPHSSGEIARLMEDYAQLKKSSRGVWRCFHCDEVFDTPGGARDHFGASEGATPGCILKVQLGDERGWLMELRKTEEAHEQQLQRALEAERDVERLECRVVSLSSDMKFIKPFANCDSMRDVFNVYDSMEGRALAAEERSTKAEARVQRLEAPVSDGEALLLLGEDRYDMRPTLDKLVTARATLLAKEHSDEPSHN